MGLLMAAVSLLAAVPATAQDLTVELSIDPVGTVDPRTGDVTITGTITCSPAADFAGVDGEVRQRVGRQFISGFFFTFSEPCVGETPFVGEVQRPSGVFKPGTATVDAFAFGCIEGEDEFVCDDDFETATIRLRPTRGSRS
ncbi:MAG: hypothetical protein M3276_07260 [Actinomycetota bacterium]|nr:hypothetical protein [Actinomycetota bacterium]